MVFYPENYISSEKFPIFCPRSFKITREKILKTARKEKIVPEKKQRNTTREKKSLPEKKYKIVLLKIQKIIKFMPEKNTNQPENKSKKLPEKALECYESLLKRGREKYFPPKKKQKMVSRSLFIFSGKKKHCVVYLPVNRGWHVLLLSYHFCKGNVFCFIPAKDYFCDIFVPNWVSE